MDKTSNIQVGDSYWSLDMDFWRTITRIEGDVYYYTVEWPYTGHKVNTQERYGAYLFTKLRQRGTTLFFNKWYDKLKSR